MHIYLLTLSKVLVSSLFTSHYPSTLNSIHTNRKSALRWQLIRKDYIGWTQFLFDTNTPPIRPPLKKKQLNANPFMHIERNIYF